jgi:YfiH family protein
VTRTSTEAAGGLRPAELCPGVLGLFTGRAGGVSRGPFESLNLGAGVGDEPSAVAANRQRLARACGLAVSDLAWMHQVHSADVRYLPAGTGDQPAPQVDAIFTDVPGLALVVVVADCTPVLLADPAARVVGAAHAGREGVASGVVPALVAAMSAAGAEPERMSAVVGPAICGGCYEVPAELQARVGAEEPETICTTRAGTAGIDIRAGVRAQLARSGVSSVRTDARCSAESPDLYSYRRDGRTGRFAGVIWMGG